MNKEPYKRYVEGSRVFYDVLASKGTFYYTVEMLGCVALSCECTGNAEFKRHCKHMTIAEKAEQSVILPTAEEQEAVRGALNGDRGFSLLRK
jgi:hypothetical protein